MISNDFVKAIRELNDEIYEKFPEYIEQGFGYSLLTNGYVDIIEFNSYEIFNSEDGLEDEYETLTEFKILLKNEAIKYINRLSNLV